MTNNGYKTLISTHGVKLFLEAQQSLAVTEGASFLHAGIWHCKRGHPVILRFAILPSSSNSTPSACLAAGACPGALGAGPVGVAFRCGVADSDRGCHSFVVVGFLSLGVFVLLNFIYYFFRCFWFSLGRNFEGCCSFL